MPPLTYTTEPPTEPGWYWMRLPWSTDSDSDECVQVYHDRDGVLRAHYGSAPVNPRPALFPAGTLWAGPIPRPVEA